MQYRQQVYLNRVLYLMYSIATWRMSILRNFSHFPLLGPGWGIFSLSLSNPVLISPWRWRSRAFASFRRYLKTTNITLWNFLYWKQKGVCRFIWSSLYEEVSTCSFQHSAALALGLFSLAPPHRHPHPSWCSGAYTCTFNDLSALDVIVYEIIKTIHFTYFIGTISIKKTQNFELIPHLAKSPASPPPSIRSISFSGGRRKTQLCWNPHSPRFWLLLLGCDLFWCLLATGAHHP